MRAIAAASSRANSLRRACTSFHLPRRQVSKETYYEGKRDLIRGVRALAPTCHATRVLISEQARGVSVIQARRQPNAGDTRNAKTLDVVISQAV